MSSSLPTVGFIGLGAMGAAMALRLAQKGYPMVVFDTRADAATVLREAGARVAASPRELADLASIVFACLPGAAASLTVALGDEGVVHGRALRTYIETSTIGVATVKTIGAALARRAVTLIDAPVSGGPRYVPQGRLAVMMAGPPAALEDALPVFRALSDKLFRVGDEAGLGQAMKLVNNLLGAAALAITAEGMVLGVKAGLDPATMLAVINAGTGRNSATEDKFPKSVLPGSFDYGASVAIMTKDVQLAMDHAQDEGLTLPLGAELRRIWESLMQTGDPQADFTTIVKPLEAMAGVAVRSRPAGSGSTQ